MNNINSNNLNSITIPNLNNINDIDKHFNSNKNCIFDNKSCNNFVSFKSSVLIPPIFSIPNTLSIDNISITWNDSCLFPTEKYIKIPATLKTLFNKNKIFSSCSSTIKRFNYTGCIKYVIIFNNLSTKNSTSENYTSSVYSPLQYLCFNKTVKFSGDCSKNFNDEFIHLVKSFSIDKTTVNLLPTEENLITIHGKFIFIDFPL